MHGVFSITLSEKKLYQRRKARRARLFDEFQLKDLELLTKDRVNEQGVNGDISQENVNQMSEIRGDITGRMLLAHHNT